MSKIQEDKKWVFDLAVDPDDSNLALYHISTLEGRRAIRPRTVLAFFLKALLRMANELYNLRTKHLTILLSEDYMVEQYEEIYKAAQFAETNVDIIKVMGN